MSLSQNIFDLLFLVMMIIIIAGVFWMPATWLLLSIFTPKTLLEKYFKEPYFTQAETILMAQFPGFLMRTAIFGWLLLLPRLDKKRNLKGLSNDTPKWYRIALKVFTIATMTTLFLILFIMIFLLFMSSLFLD